MIYKNQEQVCLTPNQLNQTSSIMRLWLEDAIWSRAYVLSIIGDQPYQSAVTDRLFQVPTDFYEVLKVFWGEEIAIQYMNYMIERISHQKDLLKAMIRQDQAEVDMHTRELYANADGISTFFDQFPRWDKNVWQQFLYSDIRMYLNQVTAMMSGNYSEAITIFDRIVSNTIDMGNYMAFGIITRSMFNTSKAPTMRCF